MVALSNKEQTKQAPKKFSWATVQAQKNDIRKNWAVSKAPALIFSVLVLVALAVPFVAMLWAPTDSTTENRELAPAPQLFNEDGGFNINVLSDAGAYFEDHFAYRTNLVDADANVYATLFGESVTDQVVSGTDGWLYYAGTVNDFQNREAYTERQANNIAHNLSLLQQYCQENGSAFVFTAAPNKSTVYPEHMSAQYPQRENENMDLLEGYLDKYSVNYLDSFELVDGLKSSANKPLYFLRDSHWNDKTAALVANELASSVDAEVQEFSENDFTEVTDYVGDLNKMLYPLSAQAEANYYAAGVNDGGGEDGTFRSGSSWSYVTGASTEDSSIQTTSAGSDESVVMYRDSFANNLVPFMAAQYGSATFSKLVPYNALTVADEHPSVVVVERAERHVDYLAEQAFIMPAPQADVEKGADVVANAASGVTATCDQGANGPLLLFQGAISGMDETSPESTIYLRLTGADGQSVTYEAFNISDNETDWGYAAYVYASQWSGQEVSVEVLIDNEGDLSRAGEFSFDIE